MDIFPTLIEEYDLTSHPDLDTWKKHIKDSGKTNPHSLAVNGEIIYKLPTSPSGNCT